MKHNLAMRRVAKALGIGLFLGAVFVLTFLATSWVIQAIWALLPPHYEPGQVSFAGTGDAVLPVLVEGPQIMWLYTQSAKASCLVTAVDENGAEIAPGQFTAPHSEDASTLPINWGESIATQIEVTGNDCEWVIVLSDPERDARHFSQTTQSINGLGPEVIAIPAGTTEVAVGVRDNPVHIEFLIVDDTYKPVVVETVLDDYVLIEVPPSSQYLVVQTQGEWFAAIPFTIWVSPNDES